MLAELPLVEQCQRDIACPRVRDHLALEEHLWADVVGERGQDRRVLRQVESTSARASHGAGSGESATASIASVAEPPLPKTSSVPATVE